MISLWDISYLQYYNVQRSLSLAAKRRLFMATLQDGPTFVKFYAPWCGHCKKLAPTWTQLAAQFRNKLNIAEVNCESYKDICKQEGIQGFPTLMYYSSPIHKKEYTGGRKLDQLKKFADLAIAP